MKKVFKHNEFTAVFEDENGYFSLTGDCAGGSGAIGDTIVKHTPEFKLLNDMHLADCKTGAPMHALENGFYYLRQEHYDPTQHYYNLDALANYWKVTFTKEQKDKLQKYLDAGVWEDIDNITKHQRYNTEDDKEKHVRQEHAQLTKKYVEQFMNEEIAPIWKEKAGAVYEFVNNTPSNLTEEDEDFDIDDCDEPEKVRALAAFLDCDASLITEDGNNMFAAMGNDYLVVTDDEADDLWDEDLENYIDECLEIPESVANYFDREAWKRDARMDGRGHSLGRYDGNENQEQDPDTGETFFIYRQ